MKGKALWGISKTKFPAAVPRRSYCLKTGRRKKKEEKHR